MRPVSLLLIWMVIFSLFLSGSGIGQPITCEGVAKINVKPNKFDYRPGENFDVDIFVTNNIQRQTNLFYTARLSKDQKVFYTLSRSKLIDPGTNVFPLRSLFEGPITFPGDGKIGEWNFEFNTQVEDCIWQNSYIFYLGTCSDGIQNSDELGIDCGGSCKNACADVIESKNQLIYDKAYYKDIYNEWVITDVNMVTDAMSYMDNAWIDGESIIIDLPEETSKVATYGCCCVDCDNKYNCNNIQPDTRLDVRSHNDWLCGWNVFKR